MTGSRHVQKPVPDTEPEQRKRTSQGRGRLLLIETWGILLLIETLERLLLIETLGRLLLIETVKNQSQMQNQNTSILHYPTNY